MSFQLGLFLTRNYQIISLEGLLQSLVILRTFTASPDRPYYSE